MARDLSLLASSAPSAIVPTEVTISHVQLRDLIICPRDAGVVNYVQRNRILEHNVRAPNAAPRIIADLTFAPNSLTSLRLGPSEEDVLIAAGGQDADIHISYHSAGSSSKTRPLKSLWSIDGKLAGSINNSVLLTTATSPSLSVAQSNESSVEPRIGVSNNDCTVRLYDIPLKGPTLRRIRRNEQSLKEAGVLKLDVPINHSSISPDGQTLLSVGDSNKVYIHSITGGSRVTLTHITILPLPPPDYSAIPAPSSSLVASFSTAFSGDGLKFAIASQEGVVAVWDIRSSKPLKVYHTAKTRTIGNTGFIGNGQASSWLSDDPWDWTRGSSRAPGWSVRNVKFGGKSRGKEVLTFTEHTSLFHVIDARTFETEEIFQMPTIRRSPVLPISTSASQPAILRQTPTTPTTNNRYLQPPATAPPAAMRRTSNARHQPFYSFPSPSPSPRPSLVGARNGGGNSSPTRVSRTTTPSIVYALGDAFRVPYSPPASIGDSTWRTLSGLGPSRGTATVGSIPQTTADRASEAERDSEREREQEATEAWQSAYDDIVVIPPLGDTDVESEVHALLQIHGISARQSSNSLHEEEDDDDDDRDDDEMSGHHSQRWRRPHGMGAAGGNLSTAMEVDELESDCTSSHAPSRSGSPAPVLERIHRGTLLGAPLNRGYTSPPPARWSTASTSSGSRARTAAVEDDEMEDMEDEDGVLSDARRSETDGLLEREFHYDNDLDLAGVCFDPKAENIYVASARSVGEWKVRGAEKTWWAGDEWR